MQNTRRIIIGKAKMNETNTTNVKYDHLALIVSQKQKKKTNIKCEPYGEQEEEQQQAKNGHLMQNIRQITMGGAKMTSNAKSRHSDGHRKAMKKTARMRNNTSCKYIE
eukprot:758603_1